MRVCVCVHACLLAGKERGVYDCSHAHDPILILGLSLSSKWSAWVLCHSFSQGGLGQDKTELVHNI